MDAQGFLSGLATNWAPDDVTGVDFLLNFETQKRGSPQAILSSEFLFTPAALSECSVLALFHALLWWLHTPSENSGQTKSDMVKVEIEQI